MHCKPPSIDLIDDKLSIPVKQQGLLMLYNGLDIHQTCNYIKLLFELYVDKICQSHTSNRWMKTYHILDCPTPLPTTQNFMKTLQDNKGNSDPVVQQTLEKKMGFSHRSGIGQLVYPMVCCHPDLSFATVKLSQYNMLRLISSINIINFLRREMLNK
jgi:hypothetical protein